MTSQFANTRILIVDHNEGMRSIVGTVLRGLGFPRVEIAENGEQALLSMRKHAPDLIITELKMPVMDGLTFLKHLRLDEKNPNNMVPVIVASGHTEDKYVRACLSAGADHFLARPISGHNVADRINRIIRDDRKFIRTEDYFGPARNLKAVEMMQASKKAA